MASKASIIMGVQRMALSLLGRAAQPGELLYLSTDAQVHAAIETAAKLLKAYDGTDYQGTLAEFQKSPVEPWVAENLVRDFSLHGSEVNGWLILQDSNIFPDAVMLVAKDGSIGWSFGHLAPYHDQLRAGARAAAFAEAHAPTDKAAAPLTAAMLLHPDNCKMAQA